MVTGGFLRDQDNIKMSAEDINHFPLFVSS